MQMGVTQVGYRDEIDDAVKKERDKRYDAEKARLEAIPIEERAELLWKDYVQRTLLRVRWVEEVSNDGSDPCI